MIRETTIQKLLPKLITLYDRLSIDNRVSLAKERRELGIAALYQYEMGKVKSIKDGVVKVSLLSPDRTFTRGTRSYSAEQIMDIYEYDEKFGHES